MVSVYHFLTISLTFSPEGRTGSRPIKLLRRGLSMKTLKPETLFADSCCHLFDLLLHRSSETVRNGLVARALLDIEAASVFMKIASYFQSQRKVDRARSARPAIMEEHHSQACLRTFHAPVKANAAGKLGRSLLPTHLQRLQA